MLIATIHNTSINRWSANILYHTTAAFQYTERSYGALDVELPPICGNWGYHISRLFLLRQRFKHGVYAYFTNLDHFFKINTNKPSKHYIWSWIRRCVYSRESNLTTDTNTDTTQTPARDSPQSTWRSEWWDSLEPKLNITEQNVANITFRFYAHLH